MYFKIFASMQLDSMEGWVWTNNDIVSGNSLVIIRNLKNQKKIKCYKRTIDANFTKNYNRQGDGRLKLVLNENVMVMNEYYRTKLGVSTQCQYDLGIRLTKWYERIFTYWNHPNPVVQYGARMGILALLLTFMSLFFALPSLEKFFVWIISGF